jgi:hypothetical protein
MSPFKIKQLAVSIQFSGIVIPTLSRAKGRNLLFAGNGNPLWC